MSNQNIASILELTEVIMSCRNLKGGFERSFSVKGGFLIIFPRVSCVFFAIFGSIVLLRFHSFRSKYRSFSVVTHTFRLHADAPAVNDPTGTGAGIQSQSAACAQAQTLFC